MNWKRLWLEKNCKKWVAPRPFALPKEPLHQELCEFFCILISTRKGNGITVDCDAVSITNINNRLELCDAADQDPIVWQDN